MSSDLSMQSKGQILLVDDDIELRELLAMLLRSDGYEVVTRGDGAAGLAQAIASLPALVLTDWHMPLLDGLELARELHLHDQTGAIPVILMTGDSCPPEAAGLTSAQLRKPFDLEYLLRVIELFCDKPGPAAQRYTPRSTGKAPRATARTRR